MKGSPIHRDLSTSFVNLPALVRHLLNMQFTGTVRVELSSYEAEIIFTPAGKIQAREHDRLVGRISQGEAAYKRILVRSREPHGRVHVQPASRAETTVKMRKPYVDSEITAAARLAAFGDGDRLVTTPVLQAAGRREMDGGEGLDLAIELIQTVQEAFGKARISFDKAFQSACENVADLHPFLNAAKGEFEFAGGNIRLSERVATRELFEGITAALAQVLSRLCDNPKFTKVHVYARHRVQLHLSARHAKYSRMGLVEVVDRLLVR